MKTLKITEQTHRELTEIQAKLYNEQGLKMTYNEIINGLITVLERYKHEHK